MTAERPLVVGPGARRLDFVRRYLRAYPWLLDAAVAGFYVFNTFLAARDPYQPITAPVAVTLAVAGAAVLVLRRRVPLVAVAAFVIMAVASLLATGQLGGTELGFAFALYAVAVARPANHAWGAGLVAVAATSAAVWAWQDDAIEEIVAGDGSSVALVDERIASTFSVAVMALVGIALGISVRLRRERLADLVERAAALERDQERLAQVARAEERARIAREVHDVVAHSISVMVTLADGAGSALERDPERSRLALEELSRTGRAALGDMRGVLGALTEGEAPLGPSGETRGLRDLVERFRAAGLEIRAEGLGLTLPEHAGLRLAVYRVVQESLTNVLRHAPASPVVSLAIQHEPGRWVVEVADQGAREPVAESDGAGMGLIGMRERVGLLGGTVEAGPSGHGWRVTAELPVEKAS